MTYDSTLLEDPSPASWKPVVGVLSGMFLGLVLLVAAWGKAIHPAAFVEQIRFEGLDFFGQASTVALLAIVLEVALGTALVLNIRRWWVLLPTVLLVSFFLFLTGRSYWRFEQGLITVDESCGCFGNLVSRTPAQAFWQDLILLGLPLALMFSGRSRDKGRRPRIRLLLVAVMSIAAAILALKAPDLPLDNLATRLRPGVSVAELCAGGRNDDSRICLDTLIADLDRGQHWVVLTGLGEEDFLSGLTRLSEQALADGETHLWVVSAASEEDLAEFNWTQAPAFEVREAPEALLKPLYRTLPRSFKVIDGEVVETRSGLPPGAF
jgi:uncharacterized membrane protein YphA (DoxX/SURF4 family)